MHSEHSRPCLCKQSLYICSTAGRGSRLVEKGHAIRVFMHLPTCTCTLCICNVHMCKPQAGTPDLPPGICRGRNKHAQEGHGAIAPVDPMIVPEEIFTHMQKVKGPIPSPSELTMGQKKLYELIWRRTLASQMAPSRVNQVSLGFRV